MALRKTVAIALALLSGAEAQLRLVRTYDVNSDFFTQFDFRDRAYFENLIGTHDPTDGTVDYVSRSTALTSGLAEYRGNQVYLGADSTSVVPSSSTGRRSIRLESKETFNSGLLIADIAHMPGNACGVWPAFWSFNFEENPYSEIDILEGSGWTRQNRNIVSLHNCGTCSFPGLTGPQGTEVRQNCNLGGGSTCSEPTNYPGCGVEGSTTSFGTAFNTGGGGVYATHLSSTGLRIWHFARNSIPSDITSGNPNPANWPAPQANFASGNSCNVPNIFRGQTIIINIDFCGSIIYDWAQQTQGHPECGSSCESYVRNNPTAYREAYWLFNSIKLYQ